MPDPIVTGFIAAASAIIGGLIAAVARPWGQDYINRKADERAAARRKEEQEAAQAVARKAEKRDRLLGIETALAGVSGSGIVPTSTSAMASYRGLRSVAADVGDPALIDAIGRINSTGYGSAEWLAAKGDASHRTGELLRELREAD
jgi:hypothetical protein